MESSLMKPTDSCENKMRQSDERSDNSDKKWVDGSRFIPIKNVKRIQKSASREPAETCFMGGRCFTICEL